MEHCRLQYCTMAAGADSANLVRNLQAPPTDDHQLSPLRFAARQQSAADRNSAVVAEPARELSVCDLVRRVGCARQCGEKDRECRALPVLATSRRRSDNCVRSDYRCPRRRRTVSSGSEIIDAPAHEPRRFSCLHVLYHTVHIICTYLLVGTYSAAGCNQIAPNCAICIVDH